MTFSSVMPNLYTADVARSVEFYRDLPGATQVYAYPAEGPAEHVELRVGDVIVGVTDSDAATSQGLPSPTQGHPAEFVFWCDGVDEAIAGLRSCGVPKPARSRRPGVSRPARLPSGTR